MWLDLYIDKPAGNGGPARLAPRPIGLVSFVLHPTTSAVLDCAGGMLFNPPEYNCASVGGTWDKATSSCKLKARVPAPIQSGKTAFSCPPGSVMRQYHYDVGNTNNAFFVACEVL